MKRIEGDEGSIPKGWLGKKAAAEKAKRSIKQLERLARIGVIAKQSIRIAGRPAPLAVYREVDVARIRHMRPWQMAELAAARRVASELGRPPEGRQKSPGWGVIGNLLLLIESLFWVLPPSDRSVLVEELRRLTDGLEAKL